LTVLLVDGNNLAMRAIHAMAKSPLSADGVRTGPVLVFINALSKHVRDEQPDRVVVCWDSGPSLFRRALYADYKANRTVPSPSIDESKRTSFALIKEFLALANVHQVERPGFEADDLVAWYVANRCAGDEIVILSSDKDFLQLLGPEVQQVRLSSGGAPTDRWTVQRVREEFGCEPQHLVLAMALAGDKIDGVPGVPRFGMKTALKQLAQYGWSLDAIDHPAVQEHREQIEIALRLVDLRTPASGLTLTALPPFDPTRLDSALFGALVSFLVRYQMETVKGRMYAGELWKEPSR
jgi:5'-3' exonuclease